MYSPPVRACDAPLRARFPEHTPNYTYSVVSLAVSSCRDQRTMAER